MNKPPLPFPQKKTHNDHYDIFNAKDAPSYFIKNDQQPPNNIFKQKLQQQYDKYKKSCVRNIQQKHQLNQEYRPNQYTYNLKWYNTPLQGRLTQVNQNVQFNSDYHHQRKLDQLSSAIFPDCQRKKYEYEILKNQSKKYSEQDLTKSTYIEQNPNFGRKCLLQRQWSDNSKSYVHQNNSNLFDMADRQKQMQKNSQLQIQEKKKMDPLISHKLVWSDKNPPKSWQVDESPQYHKRKYFQNMKSSLDCHTQYDKYIQNKKNEVKKIQAPIQISNNDQIVKQKQIVHAENLETKCMNKKEKKNKDKNSSKIYLKRQIKSANKFDKIQSKNNKKQCKDYSIEIRQGWKFVNIKLLGQLCSNQINILGFIPNKNKEMGHLNINCKVQLLIPFLRALRQRGIIGIRL